MSAATPTNGRKAKHQSRRNSQNSNSQSTGGVLVQTKKALSSMFPAVGKLLSGSIDLEFDSLSDLYLKELEDLYSAENQLLKALPKMAEAASSKDLRAAFEAHLKETQRHVERLDKVFETFGAHPKASKCKAMAGLIAEGDEWMRENATSGVMDAGLIAAAQRVEHYEIAGYGCVRTYARLLGNEKAVALLQQTLEEEGAADKKLTQLSNRINVQAESGEESAKRAKKKSAKSRRASSRAAPARKKARR